MQVVVNALDKDDSFLNFLDMNASALGPDLQPLPLRMRQTAPGRYVGSFPSQSAGSYFVNVLPGPGATPLTTGVTVPYSEEFRVRESNQALIEALASVAPRGGETGWVTSPLEETPSEELIDTDAFRGGLALARSIKDAWPWFVLSACCLFLADVFVRRVAVNFDWVGRSLAKIAGRDAKVESQVTARLDALKRQKDAMDESLQKRRASVRFEPTSVDTTDDSLAGRDVPVEPKTKQASDVSSVGPADEKSYTERLLEAKRKARKDKP